MCQVLGKTDNLKIVSGYNEKVSRPTESPQQEEKQEQEQEQPSKS
jgi:hypothetical protein